MRRDAKVPGLPPRIFPFQPTRPHGARPHESLGSRAVSVPFQSARPRGTRLRAHQACPGGYSSFNPRARVGRDVAQRAPRCGGMVVSIHGPAWGATNGARLGTGLDSRFNPRARVGRDKVGVVSLKPGLGCFNPRARVGRDDVLLHDGQVLGLVSIHAPARGATCSSAHPVAGLAAFQSTRPRGARLARSRLRGRPFAFQSTRPRGARPRLIITH